MSSANSLPQLAGHRDRRRKKDIRARFDPEQFQELLLGVIKGCVSAVPPESVTVSSFDKDALMRTFNSNADRLQFEQSSSVFLEILFVGGILDAGGNFEFPAIGKSPLSVIACADDKEIRHMVDIFLTIIARYRYMQDTLKETVERLLSLLIGLQANLTPEQISKLVTAFAMLCSSMRVPVSALSALLKGYLVKDGIALKYLTAILKTMSTLPAESAEREASGIDALTLSLRRSDLDTKLLEFFPENRRTYAELKSHFAAHNLSEITRHYLRVQQRRKREELQARLEANLRSESPVLAECANIIKSYMPTAGGTNEDSLSETDVTLVVWNAIMRSVTWSSKSDLYEKQALRQVKTNGKLLAFCTRSPTSELALMNAVQMFCHEDQRFVRIFPQLVAILYNEDAVSSEAIRYWYDKGAVNKGREGFRKQVDTLLKQIESAEEDSDDEESDSE